MNSPAATIKRRPAETAAPVALAIAYLLARLIGLQDDQTFVWAVSLVVAFIPAAITFIVNTVRAVK